MTPRELSERLAGDVENICHQLLPAGKRIGSNWCVGGVSGAAGDSCKIQLTGIKAGIWADFASDDKGDILTLYSKVKGVSLCESIQWAKEYLGVYDCSNDFKIHKPIALKKTFLPQIQTTVLDWFKARKITEEALKQYKITSTGAIINFPYYKDGELFFVKYRDVSKPKEKAIYAEQGGTQILFGWQAIPEDAREVVIVEGEPDALAYASQGIPALSVPVGGGTGNKQDNWIQNDFDRLQQFDTIYLSLDMDTQGQDAVNAILPRLGNHRCKIVTLPRKDANECLIAGDDLNKYLQTAKHRDPDEIKPATYFINEVHKAFDGLNDIAGDYTPWIKASDLFRMRPGEVTIWQGINGHGKSLILSHVISNCCVNQIRCCVASMEMRPVQQLHRIYQQIAGIDRPSTDAINQINEVVMPFLFIVNIHGTAKTTRLLELFNYAVLRFGCTQFVVDSLAKCGMAEDDYNAQKLFVEKLSDFAHSTLAHVHLVCHARKQEDEMRVPNKMDVKGTGALTDMVDNVISVWRNKKKEDERSNAIAINAPIMPSMRDKPDCILSVQKQRNWDWEGKILLWFNPSTHQYLESQQDKPEPMIHLKQKREVEQQIAGYK